MKKYIIGGAAVAALGVVLLGWTTVRSFMAVAYNDTKQAISDAEPVESKIKRAKVLLKDIDPAIERCLHEVATEKVAADNLEKRINDQSKALAVQEAEMSKLAGLMKSSSGEFQFAAKTLTNDTARAELARRLKSCSTQKKTLASLETTLQAKRKIVADGQTRLDAMKSQREELKQKISMMEAKVQELKMQETTHQIAGSTAELDAVTALLDEVQTNIDVRAEVARQHGADVNAETADETPVSQEDLLKQVEEYSKQPANAPAVEEGPKT